MSENRYSLKFTPKAGEDLEQIYIYISEKLFAEISARNLLENIEQSIMRLRDFPYSCSIVSDEHLKSRDYRKLIIKNYIVFYLVDDAKKQVVVMRIVYGSQNYQQFL